jgi:hypothetical protein
MIERNHIPDAKLKGTQAVRHGDTGLGLDTTVVNKPHPTAFGFHHAPAHEGITRVNAQNDQKTASSSFNSEFGIQNSEFLREW